MLSSYIDIPLQRQTGLCLGEGIGIRKSQLPALKINSHDSDSQQPT